ncbi:MAG: hypothetical protein PHE24_03740 [Patescibacteria group bacterium]|nr:hypothetical protein [Patescibacteria group bacterium]
MSEDQGLINAFIGYFATQLEEHCNKIPLISYASFVSELESTIKALLKKDIASFADNENLQLVVAGLKAFTEIERQIKDFFKLEQVLRWLVGHANYVEFISE